MSDSTKEELDHEYLKDIITRLRADLAARDEMIRRWNVAAMKHYPVGWAVDPGNPELVIANIIESRDEAVRVLGDAVGAFRCGSKCSIQRSNEEVDANPIAASAAAKETSKQVNPNDMSFDECRFYLLPFREPGFRRSMNGVNLCVKEVQSEEDAEPRYCYAHIDNLFPPTLAAIVSAMPEGWVWTREYLAMDGDPAELMWIATSKNSIKCINIMDTEDEILDRARLAVGCHMAEKENEK